MGGLFLVSGGIEDGATVDGERRRTLAEIVTRCAGPKVLVRSPGDPIGPELANAFDLVIDLDADQLAWGTALDGLVRDLAPHALVALGNAAALAAGRLVETPPCWLDFPGDPVGDGMTLARPWGRREDLDFWHALLWSLDRADRISCGTSEGMTRIETVLALRGGLGEHAGEVLIRDSRPPAAPLRDWLEHPRRRAARNAILGQPEISVHVAAQNRASDLARVRSRSLVRFDESVRRAGARAARGISAAGRGAVTAAAVPLVALDAARLSWTSRGPASSVAEPADLPALERRLGRRPRLLIVMPYRIFPPRHGGAVRLAGLLEQLAERCELHVLRFDQRGENRIERAALERFCRRVEFHHWIVPPRDAPPDRWLPPSVSVFRDERAAWRIRQWVESESIDVVQLEYVEMAQFRAAAKPARVVLVEHDVAFRSQERRRRLELGARFSSEAQHRATWLDLLRLRRYELTAVRQVDQLHLMSRIDAELLARYLPDGARRIRVVPNAVDTTALAPLPGAAKEGEVLFVGNFSNLPNQDALEWLLAEIWPRVRAARPEAKLTVVGAEMPSALRDLAQGAGANVIGAVPDIGVHYRSHRVLAVPLRAGSGTRLKILEAFSTGIPVVSTRLGVEGIDAEHGAHLEIADDPAGIAAALVELSVDERRGEALATAARRLVTERYDVARAAEANLQAVYELACESERRAEAPLSESPRSPALDVSVVIPTRRGGRLLERVLTTIAAQRTARSWEVVCIDSGSSAEELRRMAELGARVVRIPDESFDHGRTRDRGAAESCGRVLVFLNQDAVPVDECWLDRLTEPLFSALPPAAVQGGIREFEDGDPDAPRRLYWDSGGPRFNFTREARGWIARHGGVGFSTVNCAIRREVWRAIPFGRMKILEDKLWQARATEREHRIVVVAEAAVRHTHDYDLRGLVRRSIAEGEGWRRVGERYRLRDAIADALSGSVWRDWRDGIRRRSLRTAAEWLFPLARPYGLWRGNLAAGREIR